MGLDEAFDEQIQVAARSARVMKRKPLYWYII